MKRWIRIFIISVFAVAAVSLVVIQFYQTRRTFSINDNMFNVGVGNAMDEVIRQLGGDALQPSEQATVSFNYQELDSLIEEQLLVNGIDLHPDVGLYNGTERSFLYSSDPQHEQQLEESPYRYNFHPAGVVSNSQFFIILSFPSAQLFLQRNSNLFVYLSFFLVIIIAAMFIISLRAMANQRKLDQMKSEFINNMTHEIKTPLATIGLACEMLRDESISQDAASRQNFIGIINDENQRMRVLVETILQSAKMSNKNFRINPKEVDVHQIISKVSTSFTLPVANRGGQLTTDLQADPSVIVADELHLTNLVYNLIDNGIKYSTEAPDITVSTRTVNGMLELSVKDHGIGISKADQKHVFEKFYRVSTGNVHNVKGFGIGLNYVAQVVKLHHGHITLESEPGQGSTFIVTLPM
ncbi:MAG: HAMP domain-containing histidine kinase [Bacteroidales bacterium]|nr:HAMP domain-containing histidine kinase [Bacteroidales bacterium]